MTDDVHPRPGPLVGGGPPRRERATIHRVSAAQAALDEALTLVDAAAQELFGLPGADDPDLRWMLLGRHCLDVVSLLLVAGATQRECGDVLDAGAGADPVALLERAARVLDSIAPRDRPDRLTPARVELAAVLDAATLA